jgi:capsular polysaccharide transport system permease protein
MLKRNTKAVQPGTARPAPRIQYAKRDVAVIDDEQNVTQLELPRTVSKEAFVVTELPRRRRWGAPLAFLLMVLLPSVAAGYYFFKLATPQYVSEFHFGVRSADAAKNDATTIFQGMAAASQIGLDSYMVVEFIKSRSMLEVLEKEMDFRQIFGAETVDWLSRLPAEASAEQKVKYWQKHVEPYFDLTTGSVSVRVRTFTPEDSQKIADLILARSQRLVNETSQNARNDAMKIAQTEVERAEVRMTKAVQAVQAFRNAAGSINPTKEAESSLRGVEAVQEELTRAKAQLAVQQSYLAAKSPAVVATKRRIEALSAQMESLKSAITSSGTDNKSALSEDIGKFDTLTLEQKFAEEHYTSALASLERAKLQAERQVSYLSVFIRPTLATSSTYPDPYQSTLIAFISALGLWLLGLILVRSIRDK